MVLKLRSNISININPRISSSSILQPNGLWKFDYIKYHKLKFPNINRPLDTETILFWNNQYESVLNGPQLMACNRCGIPDTKENLDRGVEHSRMECEEASYYYKIYKALSDECRENPGKNEDCLKELSNVRKNTKYQENSLYSSVSHVLRDEPEQWYFEFNIPNYEGINEVTQEWKYKYYDALQKIKNPSSSDDSLRNIAEDFGIIEMKTRQMMGLN